MRNKLSIAIALATATASAAIPVHTIAQEEEEEPKCYIGEIKWFAMNWVPEGFVKAEGQILNVEQHSDLFSLLGNAYGGNGQTTFALPDLRGRVAVGQGNGDDLTARPRGMRFGSETVTLNTSQLPSHHHNYTDRYTVSEQMGDARSGPNIDVVIEMTLASEHKQTVNAGDGQPIHVEQPSLVLTPGICVHGDFPTRSNNN